MSNDDTASSRSSPPSGADGTGDDRRYEDDRRSDETVDRDVLRAEVEYHRERAEQLQETYARAKKAEYRRAALGLGSLGAVAVAGAAVIPHLRTLLLSLGAIGLFGAVLTYYLSPERFISVDLGAGVYNAQREDRAALVEALGLSDHRIYVPLDDTDSRVRLFVPQFREYIVPGAEDLAAPLVVPADDAGQGLVFTPTGRDLYESFADAVSGGPTDEPGPLATQLCEALVEQFELVDAATAELDRTATALTVAVEGSAFGPVDGFDHPVASALAVALARATGRPVAVEVEAAERDGVDYLLTYRWGEDGPPDSDGN